MCELNGLQPEGGGDLPDAPTGSVKDSTPDACGCDMCEISKHIKSLREKASEDERAALCELWARMECAEMELSVQKAKREGKWPDQN